MDILQLNGFLFNKVVNPWNLGIHEEKQVCVKLVCMADTLGKRASPGSKDVRK